MLVIFACESSADHILTGGYQCLGTAHLPTACMQTTPPVCDPGFLCETDKVDGSPSCVDINECLNAGVCSGMSSF